MSRHQRTQTVRTYECDAALRMRPEVILHWIQDIAEEHASTLGFGYDMCAREGLAWVEVRLLIDICRMPEWKEEITVSTWSYPVSPVIAGREFDLRDAEGNVLAQIATQWVLIDVKRRRPVALRKHLGYFAGDPGEIPAIQQRLDGLAPVPPDAPAARFTALPHTVDFNRHVNNSFYLLWALDTLGSSDALALREIRIDFLKESMPGDEIDVHVAHAGRDELFSLTGSDGERARVRLIRDVQF